jgi:hypothetical protein
MDYSQEMTIKQSKDIYIFCDKVDDKLRTDFRFKILPKDFYAEVRARIKREFSK